MIVRQTTLEVRPFVVAAILRNIELSEFRFNSLIELQEKLHQTVGRKRALVAIGVHDLDTVKPPFFYDALPPDQITFIPLNQSEKFTASELMEFYSKDSHLKPYLPIIRDKPCYPLITDSNGVVLSMPPIINGEHSRVSHNTRNLLIECTATDLHRAVIVLDTLVTVLSEFCIPPFTIEPVEVVHCDGSSQLYPLLAYRDMIVSTDYVNRLLGIRLTDSDLIGALARMGLDATPITNRSSGGLLSVRIPPTRHDILHPCDIAEDVAIAYGYDRIPEQLPTTYCISHRQPVNLLTDQIRPLIAQAGFTEALSFSLCSREDVSTNLRLDLDTIPAVHIANPKTQDFQVVRTTLLSGILRTLAHNRGLPLPLKLFEVQDIVVKDSTKDVGARNRRHVCAVYYNKQSGFEVVHGLLDRLMRSLCVSWKSAVATDPDSGDVSSDSKLVTYELRPSDDPTYFPGRCADVVIATSPAVSMVIGRLGVLHPDVLHHFELTLPCSVLEFDLEVFL